MPGGREEAAPCCLVYGRSTGGGRREEEERRPSCTHSLQKEGGFHKNLLLSLLFPDGKPPPFLLVSEKHT